MQEIALVRDSDGTIKVDLDYVRSMPDVYVYEDTYIVDGVKYEQYLYISSPPIDRTIPMSRFESFLKALGM